MKDSTSSTTNRLVMSLHPDVVQQSRAERRGDVTKWLGQNPRPRGQLEMMTGEAGGRG
jgi:hypothetical protein